ncbi:hypothetical protein [Amycolatopsis benzoatilytica]|uniref:hypothetical protein n=1 Tax=Amycolatopsis benzoatilytica TaxID=346045 RepID=UPI0003649AB2|nr:hypothetical protein [Amycolatopsis benzoatilytica]
MTLDQQLRPDQQTGPDPAEAFYGGVFGWSVRRQGGRLFLALEYGLCAVTLPKLTAGPVLAHLRELGCAGPALILPTQRGPRLAILADADGELPMCGGLPADVQVLDSGALIPLPDGRAGVGMGPEWLSAPDPRRRWLPSVSAVIAGTRRR